MREDDKRPMLPDRPARRGHAAATAAGRLAQRHDLVRRGLLEPDNPDEIIHLQGCGLALELGERATDGLRPSDLEWMEADLAIPEAISERHILIFGKTGCGKTTKLILPMLVERIAAARSLVVCVSAKGDLTPVTLEAARRAGATVLYVSPTEPERSLHWDPMGEIHDRSEAENLAVLLSRLVERGRNETGFFEAEAVSILTSLIEGCRLKGINAALPVIAEATRTAGSLVAFARRLALRDVEEFASNCEGNHNMRTSLSTLRGYVKCFEAPDVAACLTGSDLRLGELGSQPAVLVLHLPEHEAKRLSPFTTVFVDSLISALYRKAGTAASGRLPVECCIVVDEFASAMGRLDLAGRINTLRSRRIRLVAAVQTTDQIVDLYDREARALLAGFGTHIGIPPMTMSDAEMISAQSGVMVEETARMSGGERDIVRSERRVLRLDDILSAPAHATAGQPAIWLSPGLPPLCVYPKPIYTWPEWSDFMRLIWTDTIELTDLLPSERGDGSRPPRRSQKARVQARRNARCAWCRQIDSHLSDTSAVDAIELGKQAEALLTRAGYDKLPPEHAVRKWIDGMWTGGSMGLDKLVLMLEVMASQRITVEDLYRAYIVGGSPNIQATLFYAKYLQLKEAATKR